MRADLVAYARASIARGSKSFAADSRLFDHATRERAWLLYAWRRRCDDLAGGQDHGRDTGAIDDPQARLAEVTARTETALAGGTVGDPGFDALGLVAEEVRLPPAFARDLIAGFALDAADWRPRSEDDLLRYCYHVAGSVGCMMAVVMGIDPADTAMLDRASDLGIAFQLANIMRDLEEDDRAGRCYLPMEWLVEMDVPPGEHMKPWCRDRLVVLVARLGRLAEAHAASARQGTPALSFRSAWAMLAAADIYGGIAREVVARGAHAWDHRVTTSKAQKLVSAARAMGQASARQRLYPAASRDSDLWKRPRAD